MAADCALTIRPLASELVILRLRLKDLAHCCRLKRKSSCAGAAGRGGSPAAGTRKEDCMDPDIDT